MDVRASAGVRGIHAGGLLRSGAQDAPLVVTVLLQAAALAMYPSIALVAFCLWWTANTAAHNFIHRPFFVAPAANAAFSLLLSAVMGVPQALWRDRHLAHHAGRAWRYQSSRELAAQVVVIAAVWTALATDDRGLFWAAYLPGWAAGLALCAVHGHYEHHGGTTSHYGRLYNALCFNDGYHVEHHARPGVAWTQLPGCAAPGARTSRWPPILRWLDAISLDGLERLVLRSPLLQRFVLRTHRRAFARSLPLLPPIRSALIVGGGLFPRTALVLHDLVPSVTITIVDRNPEHLTAAQRRLPPAIRFQCAEFTASGAATLAADHDLVVVPLAYVGDRDALYRNPPAKAVLIHDWIWRRRGDGRVVSFALLKRLNLVTAARDRSRQTPQP